MPNNDNAQSKPVNAAKVATKAALARDDSASKTDEDAAAADAVSKFLAIANDGPVINDAVSNEMLIEVAKGVAESRNVLVALSSDPSVDELAAAIGISIYLDKMGKRATAIYSGATPNALEFLKPEETFESTADALQDFVIALNKDKADHLRYKPDGDYVKIYITPYKSKVTQSDLEFSYGDYNVDLVLALNVANGVDLDGALREHGRILHDANVINITTGKPGKLAEIEWCEPNASSISEIMATLSYTMSGKQGIGEEEATAYLTGIVAATNRFSNARTTAASMRIASRLMESGANQQLVAKNITAEVDNYLFNNDFNGKNDSDGDSDVAQVDGTELSIDHGEVSEDNIEVEDVPVKNDNTTSLDELKAAEIALSGAGAEAVANPGDVLPGVDVEVVPEEISEEVVEDGAENVENIEPVNDELVDDEAVENEVIEDEQDSDAPNSGFLVAEPAEQEGEDEVIPGPQIPTPGASMPRKEVVVTPPENLNAENLTNPGPNKFERMMTEALNEGANPAAVMAPKINTEPVVENVPVVDYGQVNGELVQSKVSMVGADNNILPPPPAPTMPSSMMPNMPTDSDVTPVLPTVEASTPVPEPATPTGRLEQPAAQTQTQPAVQVYDPAAFKIPGLN